MHGHMWIYRGLCESAAAESDSLGLELQMVTSYLLWSAGTNLALQAVGSKFDPQNLGKFLEL